MLPSHLGPYPIIREIARGGQGAVYLAKHPQLRNYVAVKLLLDPDPIGVQRFKQEARILAKIRHPNLLQVIDYGQTGDFPYMVMEYIDGWDLKGFLAQNQPPLPRIIDIVKTIAQALSYLHQHGLVHRDIKPGNILVEKSTLRPVLADLGLAKRSDPSILSMGSIDNRLSLTGEVMGTPVFMAPEQVSEDLGDIGPWTDVYGLGSTLFQVLTGRTVYVASSAIAMYVKLQNNEQPPHPKDINQEIPDYLDEAVWAAIQKDPSARPQSMEEWIVMLSPRPKRVPVRKKRRWPLVGAGTLGVGGLAAYFLSMGASPHEAQQLARQEIATIPSSSPISSSSFVAPNTESITSLSSQISPTASSLISTDDPEHIQKMRHAVALSRSGDYYGSLDIYNELIQENPNSYTYHWARANNYFRLGDKLGAEGRSVTSREAFQSCIQDVDVALQLASQTDSDRYGHLMAAMRTEAQRRLEGSQKRRHKRKYRANPRVCHCDTRRFF